MTLKQLTCVIDMRRKLLIKEDASGLQVAMSKWRWTYRVQIAESKETFSMDSIFINHLSHAKT